jgi:periplasmic mercuric ion binding protein
MKSIILFWGMIAGMALSPAIQAQHKAPVTVSFWVGGVCEMCRERIERTVDVRGVRSAEYSLEHHRLTVTYQPSKVSEEYLHLLLNEAGHDTEKSKASDAAYDTVHGCCKYRGHDHND